MQKNILNRFSHSYQLILNTKSFVQFILVTRFESVRERFQDLHLFYSITISENCLDIVFYPIITSDYQFSTFGPELDIPV